MADKVCPNYCGVACVNGICPKIENSRYHCNECWLYKGCEDCYFKDTNMCDHSTEKGGEEE